MNPEIALLWKDLIDTSRWVRTEHFEQTAKLLREDASVRGRLTSGFFIGDLAAAAVEELRARGEAWWVCCERVLKAGKVVVNNASRLELQHTFDQEILRDHQALLLLQQKTVPKDLASNVGAGLENAKEQAKAHFRNNLGLLGLSQQASEFPLVELLQAPRYDTIREAWESALAHSDDRPSEAIREAVKAVEAAALLLGPKRNATLGDVLKHLRKSSTASDLLIAAVEKIWAYANASPNVRHGSPIAADALFAEARFCVDCAGAALRWILVMDRAT